VSITGDRVTVSIVQRYQSGNYADHGDKTMTLAPGKDGKLEIVREEMMYSAPGWDADPKAELDATTLVSPITVRVRQDADEPDIISTCEDGHCCGEVTYTVRLTDAKGKKIEHAIGASLVPFSRPTETFEPASGDPLFELGEEPCGEVEVAYRIVRDGNALVVRRNFLGEEAKQDIPWTTDLTITLPAGATIK
jgi:hypothetical protein